MFTQECPESPGYLDQPPELHLSHVHHYPTPVLSAGAHSRLSVASPSLSYTPTRSRTPVSISRTHSQSPAPMRFLSPSLAHLSLSRTMSPVSGELLMLLRELGYVKSGRRSPVVCPPSLRVNFSRPFASRKIADSHRCACIFPALFIFRTSLPFSRVRVYFSRPFYPSKKSPIFAGARVFFPPFLSLDKKFPRVFFPPLLSLEKISHFRGCACVCLALFISRKNLPFSPVYFPAFCPTQKLRLLAF